MFSIETCKKVILLMEVVHEMAEEQRLKKL